MTDFRALCARMANELDKYRQLLLDDRNVTHRLADEARTALAQPEPEGPTDQEIQEWADACSEAPLEELDPEVHGWRRCFTAEEFSETIRAAIARWGRPTPQPADGEVAELVRLLGSMAAEAELADQAHDASVLDRAINLLERLSPPQPIPVSERLPVPGDCLDEGWAWFFNPRTGWRQATQPVHSTYTHWLPAHALPVPQQ